MPPANPFDVLIAAAAGKPVALANIARTMLAKGHSEQAYALAHRIRDEFPQNAEACLLASEVLSASVPHWHFTIVRDAVRNAAYDAALRRAVRPGMRVLDIGSGTGLLAMMAARAGAAHVFTCEMNPEVARAAREIIARNGFADRITVLPKHSAQLDPQTDLGGPVDVVVSEIVSNNIVSEDPLPAMEQAVRRLLKPGGAMIPARASVRVALASYQGSRRTHMGMVDGFDLSWFNRLAQPCRNFNIAEKDLQLLSDSADIFSFDFVTGGPFPEGRASVQLNAHSGSANGIAQWIHLQMDDENQYENRPGSMPFSCWAVLFYPLHGPLLLNGSETVQLSGSHDRHSLRVWLDS